MADAFGDYLHALRQARKLTATELAQKAGIRRATLSEWQSGKRQPRSQELEAVLDALDASDAQKRKARELLRTPKAFVRLRQETERNDPDFVAIAGDIPHGGDLLRALRLRKGWTQTELAAQMAVPQSTVARWERSELWPQNEHLHRLCFLTGAHEEEMVALTTSRFRLEEHSPLSEDQIRRQMSEILNSKQSVSEYPLSELRLLTLSAQAWQMARQDKAGLPLLAEVCAQRADHLYMHWRLEEADVLSNRVFDLYASAPVQTANIERAVIRAAEISAKRRGLRGLRDAVSLLQSWRDRAGYAPNVGWMLGDLSLFHARSGQTEEAVGLARQALHLTEKVTPLDARFRRSDLARTLLLANRPHEARLLIEQGNPQEYPLHPYPTLVKAEIHFQLGEFDHVQRVMAQIFHAIENCISMDLSEAVYYAHEAKRLAEQFEVCEGQHLV